MGAFCQPATAKPNYTKKSYIDDLTLLEKISLSDLIQKKRIIGPLDFHDRFNLELPPSKAILQHQLADLTRFTTKQSMVLNTKKTKCMPFNNSQTKDFLPTLSIKEGANLEVVYQIKLVGLVVTSNMGWNEHVNYTIQRVNRTLWQLTRFKRLGADRDKLVQFYMLKILSLKEYTNVWGCLLSFVHLTGVESSQASARS